MYAVVNLCSVVVTSRVFYFDEVYYKFRTIGDRKRDSELNGRVRIEERSRDSRTVNDTDQGSTGGLRRRSVKDHKTGGPSSSSKR